MPLPIELQKKKIKKAIPTGVSRFIPLNRFRVYWRLKVNGSETNRAAPRAKILKRLQAILSYLKFSSGSFLTLNLYIISRTPVRIMPLQITAIKWLRKRRNSLFIQVSMYSTWNAARKQHNKYYTAFFLIILHRPRRVVSSQTQLCSVYNLKRTASASYLCFMTARH